jgi:hypothetical protein
MSKPRSAIELKGALNISKEVQIIDPECGARNLVGIPRVGSSPTTGTIADISEQKAAKNA